MPASTKQNNAGPMPITSAERREVRLPSGTIRYREIGSGSPIVFVHGLLVNGRLWDGVADALAPECRCIVPDWPMGSHEVAMEASADLSPPGLASIVADFLAALELEDVTVVGNDTGGAVCQILVTTRPERIGRLVLTNCDTYEHFPPFPFSLMPRIAKLPGGMRLLSAPSRIGAVRRASYAPLVAHPLDRDLVDAWVEPGLQDEGVRRDVRKATIGLDKRYTLAAAERFGQLEVPVLLAWAPEDRFFKRAHAERLAGDIPGARIEWIEDAGTFVPLDQPAAVARAIRNFVASKVSAG
jgi:pimeloyl-ACP methyl ester carboxylesterase